MTGCRDVVMSSLHVIHVQAQGITSLCLPVLRASTSYAPVMHSLALPYILRMEGAVLLKYNSRAHSEYSHAEDSG